MTISPTFHDRLLIGSFLENVNYLVQWKKMWPIATSWARRLICVTQRTALPLLLRLKTFWKSSMASMLVICTATLDGPVRKNALLPTVKHHNLRGVVMAVPDRTAYGSGSRNFEGGNFCIPRESPAFLRPLALWRVLLTRSVYYNTVQLFFCKLLQKFYVSKLSNCVPGIVYRDALEFQDFTTFV